MLSFFEKGENALMQEKGQGNFKRTQELIECDHDPTSADSVVNISTSVQAQLKKRSLLVQQAPRDLLLINTK